MTGIALSGAVGCSAVTGTTPALTLVISAPFGADDVFISDLYTVGTTVKHPATFPAGSYAVTCLYGTASSTDAATMTTGTCVKPMTVRDDSGSGGTGAVQGCSHIYGYK